MSSGAARAVPEVLGRGLHAVDAVTELRKFRYISRILPSPQRLDQHGEVASRPAHEAVPGHRNKFFATCLRDACSPRRLAVRWRARLAGWIEVEAGVERELLVSEAITALAR